MMFGYNETAHARSCKCLAGVGAAKISRTPFKLENLAVGVLFDCVVVEKLSV